MGMGERRLSTRVTVAGIWLLTEEDLLIHHHILTLHHQSQRNQDQGNGRLQSFRYSDNEDYDPVKCEHASWRTNLNHKETVTTQRWIERRLTWMTNTTSRVHPTHQASHLKFTAVCIKDMKNQPIRATKTYGISSLMFYFIFQGDLP